MTTITIQLLRTNGHSAPGKLADADFLRIAERRGRQAARGNANHGKIGARIVADQGRIEAPAVAQSDADFGRAVHDVAVG